MIWQPLREELDRWREGSITARLWLRDDDTVAPTPLLDGLAELTARYRIPVVLAVVPANTDGALVHYLHDVPHLSPAIHGWTHANHAPADQKKQELGLHRGRDIVLADLADAHRRMSDLHGERLIPMLVPPWNRIDPELVPDLPGLGYQALSAFGEPTLALLGLTVINTHVDLIDFRGTRRCHDHALLVQQLTHELSRSRQSDHSAVGILSHHLIDDPSAVRFLEELFTVTTHHPACRWMDIADLLQLE
jgi:hypothetical protein